MHRLLSIKYVFLNKTRIFRIMSVTNTFTLREAYTTNVNLTNLKVIIFPIPVY